MTRPKASKKKAAAASASATAGRAARAALAAAAAAAGGAAGGGAAAAPSHAGGEQAALVGTSAGHHAMESSPRGSEPQSAAGTGHGAAGEAAEAAAASDMETSPSRQPRSLLQRAGASAGAVTRAVMAAATASPRILSAAVAAEGCVHTGCCTHVGAAAVAAAAASSPVVTAVAGVGAAGRAVVAVAVANRRYGTRRRRTSRSLGQQFAEQQEAQEQALLEATDDWDENHSVVPKDVREDAVLVWLEDCKSSRSERTLTSTWRRRAVRVEVAASLNGQPVATVYRLDPSDGPPGVQLPAAHKSMFDVKELCRAFGIPEHRHWAPRAGLVNVTLLQLTKRGSAFRTRTLVTPERVLHQLTDAMACGMVLSNPGVGDSPRQPCVDNPLLYQRCSALQQLQQVALQESGQLERLQLQQGVRVQRAHTRLVAGSTTEEDVADALRRLRKGREV